VPVGMGALATRCAEKACTLYSRSVAYLTERSETMTANVARCLLKFMVPRVVPGASLITL